MENGDRERLKNVEGRVGEVLQTLARIEEKLAGMGKPGETPWCQLHARRLEETATSMLKLEEKVTGMGFKLAAWGGGLAVVIVLLNIFAAALRKVIGVAP